MLLIGFGASANDPARQPGAPGSHKSDLHPPHNGNRRAELAGIPPIPPGMLQCTEDKAVTEMTNQASSRADALNSNQMCYPECYLWRDMCNPRKHFQVAAA